MSEPGTASPTDAERPAEGGRGVSRRNLLFGGAGLGAGLLAGAAATVAARPLLSNALAPEHPPETFSADPTAVPSRGKTQAGIARPETPQRNALIVVADLSGVADAASVLAAIAAAGDLIDQCTDADRADPLLLPDGPSDLTITLGIGPRLVAAIDPALPGATALPAFASDGPLSPELTGGDLLIAAYASDAAVLPGVADAVLAAIPTASRRWAQTGVRGAGTGTIARNPLGYHDGVIVPRTDAELAANVWIDAGPATGGTIVVIRRLRLDTAAFHAQPLARQDQVIGRSRRDGAPLSGGSLTDDANLTAKTPEGEYLVPLHSHVRAAHPSFTGSALMLRRSYGFSNAVGPGAVTDDGLVFMCFQNDIDVFVRTQHRLDETDDLMRFAVPTASASFLILPGRRDGEPLGASLT